MLVPSYKTKRRHRPEAYKHTGHTATQEHYDTLTGLDQEHTKSPINSLQSVAVTRPLLGLKHVDGRDEQIKKSPRFDPQPTAIQTYFSE
jgi:hypothetical protein